MSSVTTTDAAGLTLLGRRLRQARLSRNLTQRDLAHEAGIGVATLQRIEAGHGSSVVNLIRVLRALGLLDRFVELVPEVSPGPIAQLHTAARERQRARGAPRP
ncbi:hypothetical protein BH24ACT23_BH24ACT23_10230 [soil metagenome]